MQAVHGAAAEWDIRYTRWIWANNALRGYKASLILLQLLDSYSLSKQASKQASE